MEELDESESFTNTEESPMELGSPSSLQSPHCHVAPLSWKDAHSPALIKKLRKAVHEPDYSNLSYATHLPSEEKEFKKCAHWALENRHRRVADQIRQDIGSIYKPEMLETPSVFLEADLSADNHGSHHINASLDKALDLDSRLKGYPGGLNMTKAQAQKYFGVEARMAFFDRCQWMQRQRDIVGTCSNLTLLDLPLDNEKINESLSTGDLPFCPVRQKKNVNFASKIVIRTTSIVQDSTFDAQWKIVAKSSLIPDDNDVGDTADDKQIEDKEGSVESSTVGGSEAQNDVEPPEQALPSSGAPKILSSRIRKLKPIVFDGLVNKNSHAKKATPSIAFKSPSSKLIKEGFHGASSKSPQKLSSLTPKRRVKKGRTGTSATDDDESNAPDLPAQLALQKKDEEQRQRNLLLEKIQGLSTTSEVTLMKTEWDFVNKQKDSIPLQLICVEERNELNRIVPDTNQTSNLMRYLASKKIRLDINDDAPDESDNDSIDDEIERMKRSSAFDIQLSTDHTGQVIRPKNIKPPLSNELDSSTIKEEKEDPAITPLSPRSRYIDNCIREKLRPRASILLRKKFSKKISMKHQRIGDEMAVLLADAIAGVPFIESLDLEDNNLTDKSLGPLMRAIMSMEHLVELNLSCCKIDQVAAECLKKYLAREDGPLERLVLRSADIDDEECANFVECMMSNRTLTDLDMSRNLIGSHEQLNSVLPDITTGGEALANLLRSENCRLRSLTLVWNMLRLDSGIDFASSLAENNTLTFLDISFNALGSEGGMVLGNSLQDNKSLRTLLISNNALDARACVTLCAGILQNEEISRVSFNGNPIGLEGARTLMLLPTIIGMRVKLSATGCNMQIKDPLCWFDSSTLVRNYEFNLNNIFDRAVALILLQIIPTHQTYIIGYSEWFENESGKGESLKLGLVERLATGDINTKKIDKNQLTTIENLKKLQSACKNVHEAVRMFQELDIDGSGELDEEEFGQLLESLGMAVSEEKVADIIAEYDVDGGGIIEMPEFLLFLRSQSKFTEARLKELTEFPIVVRRSDPTVPYLPPKTGLLRINVIDGFKHKPTYRVMSASDAAYIDNLAASTGDLLNMTGYGVQNLKIRFDEAWLVYTQLSRESNNKTLILSKILPQISKPADARLLISKVYNNDKSEIARLKRELGQVIRPILGAADGYYLLDLAQPLDKLCLSKLLEVSSTMAHKRGQSKMGYQMVGDCSQHSNWTCFRNEMLNGKAVILTTAFVTPMPRSGKLEFDFVSSKRMSEEDSWLQDTRLINLLSKLFLIRPEERELVRLRLRNSKRETNKTLFGNAITAYEVPHGKAQEASRLRTIFYESLSKRADQNYKVQQSEGNKALPSAAKKMQELAQAQTGTRANSANAPITRNIAMKVAVIPSLLDLKDLDAEYRKAGKALSSKERRMSNLTAASSPLAKEAKERREEEERGSSAKSAQSDFSEGDGLYGASRPTTRGGTASDSDTAASRPQTAFSQTLSRPQTAKGGEDEAVEILHLKNLLDGAEDDALAIEEANNEDEYQEKEARKALKAAAAAAAEANNTSSPSKKSKRREILDSWTMRYVSIVASDNINDNSKAAKILEVLTDVFETLWIMSRHLALLCDLFQKLGQLPTSQHFGTYRVELVCSLFFCVYDLHNFEIVIKTLSAYEYACLIARIGYLNLYNPMKPEGGYEFDLSVQEERAVMKTITTLSVQEPGDNFLDIYFRWNRDMEPMPGYELTQPWMTEEGLPKKGIWGVQYYCGEGKNKKGCKPNIKLRKSLLNLVFIEEKDIINEGDRDKPESRPKLVGEEVMMDHVGLWHSYINFNPEKSLELRRAKEEKEAADAKASRRGAGRA